MTELMTLQEAFEKAGDNDLIKRHYDGHETHGTCKKQFVNHSVSVNSAVSKIWQIIPAEPWVLSAEDMLCHMDDFDRNHEPDIIKYGERMDQNGQLKQWLNHKELREAISIWISAIVNPDLKHAPNTRRIKEALENLKPLNTE